MPIGRVLSAAQDVEDLARLVSMGFGEARARRVLAHMAKVGGASSGDAVQAAMERMLADPEGARDDSAADEGNEDTASSSDAASRGGGRRPAEGPPAQEVRIVGGMAYLIWFHWLSALMCTSEGSLHPLLMSRTLQTCRHVKEALLAGAEYEQ